MVIRTGDSPSTAVGDQSAAGPSWGASTPIATSLQRPSELAQGRLRRFVRFSGGTFLLLMILPFPFRGIAPIWPAWQAFWEALVPWAATTIFGIGFDVLAASGGGEPTFHYVQVACTGIIALLVGALAAAWSHTSEEAWERPLRAYLRLFLCSTMLIYGWAKIFPVQFPALGPERLSQTFGEASPNGFLWAFMGYSRPYQIFTGMGEMLAGVLICSRRTLPLGCLLGIGVMAHVVALNFSYDVGVKIGTSFYLLAFVYLLWPDLPRVARALLSPDLTAPGADPKRRWEMAGRWMFGVAALYFLVTVPLRQWEAAHARGQWAPRPALYGLYDVVETPETVDARPDSIRWMRVAIGQSRSTIRTANGTLGFYLASVEESEGKVRFVSRDAPETSHELAYLQPHPDSLILTGTLDGSPVRMSLIRRDERAYRLVSHPFHWAQNTNENR